MRARPTTNPFELHALITETGPANVLVWPMLFGKRRQVVLGSSMMAIDGGIEREGDVVHFVAQLQFDLSCDLTALADRDIHVRLPIVRCDEFAHGSPVSPDSRDRAAPVKPRSAGDNHHARVRLLA